MEGEYIPVERHLLLDFMSWSPATFSKRQLEHRHNQYRMAMRQLGRVLPENSWDVRVCDNTSSRPEIEAHSDEFPRVLQFPVVEVGENAGTRNKGVGELDMLVAALEVANSDEYVTVSYLTGRHLVPNPYIFDRTERMQSEALVGNPDFQYLDGHFHEVAKDGMLNDMFFSMSSALIKEYAQFFLENRGMMIELHIGSEQILHRFLNERKPSIETMHVMGLVRSDTIGNRIYRRSRWHLC